jgi:hypothetical protein
VRPSTAADIPAIVELFDDAGIVPNTRPQDLDWKYWQSFGEWSGSRSFLLTARNHTPLAHCGVIPRWCTWGEQRISIVQPIDWVARTGAGGAGVTLIKQLGQRTQILLSVGGSIHTLRIVPHMGFRPVGQVTGFARPLHPLRRRGGSAVLRLPRLARGYAWKLAAPSARLPGWSVRQLSPEQAAELAPVFPTTHNRMAVLERSVELLRYMLSCPIVPFSLYALERAGQLKGYFLLSSAPGQVRIADCWVQSEDPAEWRALVLLAAAQAQLDPQAAEVVTWANDPLLSDALRSCGFRSRFEISVQVLPTHPSVGPIPPLRLQLLDNDLAYLHKNGREYWA